jgi:hypothetical protein
MLRRAAVASQLRVSRVVGGGKTITSGGRCPSGVPNKLPRRSLSTVPTRAWVPSVTVPVFRQFLSQSYYSTERIVASRSGNKDGKALQTLYNAERETENCGVGLIASLHSKPSRRVVQVADEMLVRMSHRGGCGCDPASGDGAGKGCML